MFFENNFLGAGISADGSVYVTGIDNGIAEHTMCKYDANSQHSIIVFNASRISISGSPPAFYKG